MALRTPRANGLTIAPNAVADAHNPAASVEELQAHRFWGRFTTAAVLPNASGNAAVNPAFDLMRPGDVAWVQADGLLYQLQDRGTLGGSDAVWAVIGGGSGGYVSTGCSGYTAANYYSNAGVVLRGATTGFVASVAFRVIGPPSDFGTMIGNFQIFQPTGGWHISIEPSAGVRVVFGVGQQSDGQVIENGLAGYLSYDANNALGPWWKLFGRIYVAVLNFDGTDAVGYVNGEELTVLTPAAGYEIAGPINPFIGRNANNAAPYPLTGVEVIGAGYVQVVGGITQQEIVDHTLAVMAQGDFVDLPTTGFSNMWTFTGQASAPALLADQIGALDFTRTGALTVAERLTIW